MHLQSAAKEQVGGLTVVVHVELRKLGAHLLLQDTPITAGQRMHHDQTAAFNMDMRRKEEPEVDGQNVMKSK
jgi:hypothetical protein